LADFTQHAGSVLLVERSMLESALKEIAEAAARAVAAEVMAEIRKRQPVQSPWLTSQEAASYLGVSNAYLEMLRVARQGPEYVRMGRSPTTSLPSTKKIPRSAFQDCEGCNVTDSTDVA
jgi:uncharacterized protein (DUF849 family)